MENGNLESSTVFTESAETLFLFLLRASFIPTSNTPCSCSKLFYLLKSISTPFSNESLGSLPTEPSSLSCYVKVMMMHGVLDPDDAARVHHAASVFDRGAHIEYFKSCLKVLPHYYVGLDTTRLSAVYFCTLGLDLLGSCLESSERESVIEFIYSNQLDPGQGKSLPGYCGFIGSSYCGQSFGTCCRFASQSATPDDITEGFNHK